MIKVLTVDDSLLMCRMLQAAFTGEADIQHVAHAPDGAEGLNLIAQHQPHVITLDVEMPGMNGLEFLNRLMATHPAPVVMFSSHTADGTEITLKALELGAVDFLQKPRCGLDKAIEFLKQELLPRVRAAAHARPRILRSSLVDVQPMVKAAAQPVAAMPNKSIPKANVAPAGGTMSKAGNGAKIDLIAIGSSTGGVAAVRDVLSQWGNDMPPILITQHMPSGYTNRFAERLNKYCDLDIKEAENGEILHAGYVYIAPGHAHLKVQRASKGYIALLDENAPLVSGHKPSVDVLFSSVAAETAGQAVGIILTGMGRDGADGLLKMRQAGCYTIGQNRDTCVVYGMPKAANDIGAVCQELPLEQIAVATINLFSTAQRMSMRRTSEP